MKLEICAYSVQSVLNVQHAGASRVELCASSPEGGLTPSYGIIKQACLKSLIPVHVIIRPRGGDFCYSDLEFETMKDDIICAKELGASGVVFGILTKNGEIDIARNKQLVDLAKPMHLTCHRAFDMTKDPFKALEDVIECGFKRILTSGHEQTAMIGRSLIAKLISVAKDRIEIMPGSGINKSNIKKLIEATGAISFHCSARTVIEGKMKFRNPRINMGGVGSVSEYDISESSIDEIKAILKEIETINSIPE